MLLWEDAPPLLLLCSGVIDGGGEVGEPPSLAQPGADGWSGWEADSQGSRRGSGKEDRPGDAPDAPRMVLNEGTGSRGREMVAKYQIV